MANRRFTNDVHGGSGQPIPYSMDNGNVPDQRGFAPDGKMDGKGKEGKGDATDQSIRQLWESFTQSTGMHGMSHLGRGDPLASKVRAVWWGIAITAMMSLMIYILVSAITEFYTYPMMTSYSVEVQQSLTFPAVTICNFSPLNKSKVDPDTNPDVSKFLLANSPLYGRGEKPEWNSSEFYTKEMSKGWYQDRSMELDSMFKMCFFNREMLNCSDIFSPIFTSLGHCYQFNGPERKPRSASVTGSNENLVVLVNIDQSNYIYATDPASGIQVKVHDQIVHPDDEMSEVIAGPGTTTYIQLSKEKYNFLPDPFMAFGDRGCVRLKARNNQTFTSYNQCLRHCRVKRVFQKCGCYNVADEEEGLRCSPENLTECYLPEHRTMLDSAEKVASCKCLSPCDFSMYGKQVSTSTFPSNFWGWIFIRRNLSDNMDHLKKNFLELRIFFGDMVERKFEQLPQYSLTDCIANMGGQMGLFLGASILTVTELGEFLVLVCLHCCRRKRRVRETPVTNFK